MSENLYLRHLLFLDLLDDNLVLLALLNNLNLVNLMLRGLRLQDAEARADPVDTGVAQNVNETDERDNIADAGSLGVGNSTLDRREDGTTGNTHDENTGSAASVLAQVSGTHAKDGGVHGSHEEEYGDQTANGTGALVSTDKGSQGNGAHRVDNHDDFGVQEDGDASGDESAYGKGDEGVAQHGAGLAGGETTVLVGVVDEESCNGDLGTNIAELGHEREPHIILLPEGALDNEIGVTLECFFGDLGELGKKEEHGDGSTSTGDGEVDKLHVGEGVLVGAGEEELGGDKGADEGSNTVPGLAELETGGSRLGLSDDDSVRISRGLKGRETTGNNERAGAKTTEDGSAVGVSAGGLSNGPEQDRTERVEGEAHEDGELVALALQDLGGDRGKEEVAAAKVHDLESRGFKARDAEDGLKVLVEDVKEAVGEAPEEEERDDEREGEDEGSAGEVAAREARGVDRDGTGHFDSEEVLM